MKIIEKISIIIITYLIIFVIMFSFMLLFIEVSFLFKINLFPDIPNMLENKQYNKLWKSEFLIYYLILNSVISIQFYIKNFKAINKSNNHV